MKEDIKNLEEIINLCKEEINNNDKNITATLDLEDLKSLENLLTRYKQLEEKENNKFKKIIEYEKTLEKLQKETIWKSKVEEKIEELKGTEELLSDEQGYWGGSDLLAKIEVLQELLREE